MPYEVIKNPFVRGKAWLVRFRDDERKTVESAEEALRKGRDFRSTGRRGRKYASTTSSAYR